MQSNETGRSWKVDESRWPLVVTTFGPSFQDDADVHAMTAAADALFAKSGRFFHVLDLRSIVRPANASQRRILGDWYANVKRHNANKGVIATAVLVESTLVRGAMTAVLWLTSPAGERIEAFGTMEDAVRWLQSVASDVGLTLPTTS